jgi:hypothetical protein
VAIKENGISPQIPVWDKSVRNDGILSRLDFVFGKKRNVYVCPAGKPMTTSGRMNAGNGIRYFASVLDSRACVQTPKHCPNMVSRRIVRDLDEDARDVARAKMRTKAFLRSRDERKRV